MAAFNYLFKPLTILLKWFNKIIQVFLNTFLQLKKFFVKRFFYWRDNSL